MVFYIKMMRWELWNRYDLLWRNGGSEPLEVTEWYYEEDMPEPPFKAATHQEWHRETKYVKLEELHEYNL